MRYETATYLSLKTPYDFKEIIKNFPAEIVNQLIQSDNTLYVEAETTKTDVVKFLDNFFEIGVEKKFRKHILLEVDKKEINNFSHFSILPRFLEWDKEIFCNIIRNQCNECQVCPADVKILSPVRVGVKKSKKIGIAEMFGHKSKERTLVLSPVVKKIFDDNNITGLEYERCILDDRDTLTEPEGAPPYIARVQNKACNYAGDITCIQYLCSKHKILQSFKYLDIFLYAEDLPDVDFVSVDRVVVQGEIYNYMRNSLIITRKVLELLLKNKIRGLTTRCVYLNEKFLPVILSTRNNSKINQNHEKIII